jgi:rhodanese-related sulfurtransferase
MRKRRKLVGYILITIETNQRMIELIKNILGFGPNVNLKQLVQDGAQIIDVRTKSEYQDGHISGSTNIPLQSLNNNLARIRKDKPVITCCASGMRSGSAKSILKSKGFREVYNGGGWISLRNKIL